MPEERHALTQVLHQGSAKTIEPAALREQICAFAGNSVGNFFRGGAGISYAELLYDAAGHLKVKGRKSPYSRLHGELCFVELDSLSPDMAKTLNPDVRADLVAGYLDDLERKILSQLMVVAYEKATPQQRAAVEAKLAGLAQTPEGKNLKGLSTSAALLVVGNLGGFATYTLMSTVLSAVSLGTLGFGAYTMASSLLSVALGPAGWLTLAAYGILKLGSADASKVVRLAATCAMTSLRVRE